MKNIKKLIISALICVTGISLIGCGGQTETTEVNNNVKGFNWKITKGDEVGYLIATGDIVPNGLEYYNDNIKKIVNETDGVCVPIKTTKELEIYAQNSIKGDLKNILTQEEYDKFTNILIDDLAFTARGLEEVNAYGAMEYVTMSKAYINNYTLGTTIDKILVQNYESNKKEAISLLGIEEAFSPIKETYTTSFLKEYIATMSADTIKNDAKVMVDNLDGYKKGDLTVFEKHLLDIKKNSPKEYDCLIKQGNDIYNKVSEKLKTNKKYSYCIPAYQLIGDDGIIKKLESEGYTVERINQ
ncbi:MAG: TraB/GumN family protein [Clostridium sp.]